MVSMNNYDSKQVLINPSIARYVKKNFALNKRIAQIYLTVAIEGIGAAEEQKSERFVALCTKVANHFINKAYGITKELCPPISVNNKEIKRAHAFRAEALKYIDYALAQAKDPVKQQALRDLAAENLYSNAVEYSIFDYSPEGTDMNLEKAKDYKPSKAIVDKIAKEGYELISWR